MKKTTIILSALFIILNISVYAQTGGVVISNGVATAHESAMLDVQSTEKGMLVPRMTTAQRTAISSPATGLLVFDTTTGSFWFYNGSSWEDLSGIPNQIADADNDTKVQVEKNADEDLIHFDLAGTEHFKMDGARLEVMNSGQSVFIGEGAGAADDLTDNHNVFVGYQTGQANTTGQYNTATGIQALQGNITGSDNTANGTWALINNTSGNKNTATGSEALKNNTTGTFNTAYGAYSLYENTTASNNTAIGSQSLKNNTTGYYNTATGDEVLFANTEGFNNTASGGWALKDNTTGNHNSATGSDALKANTTGSKNTAIGSEAFSTGNFSNSTALGYQAAPSADNMIRLGNNDVTSIGGHAAWTNTSDGRFKINLKENVAGLDFIMKLRPLTYHFDMDAIARFTKTPDNSRSPESEQLKAAEVQIGFIAQEVEEAATALGFDFHGVDKPQNENSHYGLRYAEFVVPLVKAMQEQQAIIEKQQAIDEQQQALISQQQDLLSKYESTFEEMNNRIEILEAKVSGQHPENDVAVK